MTFELNLDKDVGHFFPFLFFLLFYQTCPIFREKVEKDVAGRELNVSKSVQLCHRRSMWGWGEGK